MLNLVFLLGDSVQSLCEANPRYVPDAQMTRLILPCHPFLSVCSSLCLDFLMGETVLARAVCCTTAFVKQSLAFLRARKTQAFGALQFIALTTHT
jgi:hypothetical protein